MYNFFLFKSNIYFLILISFIASCAKNPVSGMPDFVTITEQQEIQMGRTYHKEILKNSKIIKNKELNKYYVELGEKIAKSSHRPDLDWKFTIIDDPTFNFDNSSSFLNSVSYTHLTLPTKRIV